MDDGSRDDTFEIANRIGAQDPHLKVLSFSRNFGHQAAVTAGLEYASGDIIAVIDADLQDPPEELGRFIDKCREGYDVVYAIRVKRKEGPLKRFAYFAYYRSCGNCPSIEIPLNTGDFCVMTRRIVDVMNALPERNRFVRGLRVLVWILSETGLDMSARRDRPAKPKYTFSKLVKLGLDGLFSFSYKPLHLLMIAGIWHGVARLSGGLRQLATVRVQRHHRRRQPPHSPRLDIALYRHSVYGRHPTLQPGASGRVHRGESLKKSKTAGLTCPDASVNLGFPVRTGCA